MDSLPYSRFGQYFKELIQKYGRNLKSELNDSLFSHIHKIYTEGKS